MICQRPGDQIDSHSMYLQDIASRDPFLGSDFETVDKTMLSTCHIIRMTAESLYCQTLSRVGITVIGRLLSCKCVCKVLEICSYII